MPKDANGLTLRAARFADGIVEGLNVTQAAIRAGFSEKTAYSQGSRLLKNVEVQRIVQAARDAAAAKAGLTMQWVLDTLRENVERAMQAQPVYEMRDGQRVETGEYRYEGAVANKALELIGKHLGGFPERIEVADVTAMSEAELEKVAKQARTKLRLIA